MTVSMNRLAHRDCLTAIATRQDFSSSTGSLHGRWTWCPNYGISPSSVRDTLREATNLGGVRERVYVVFSYDTPIAYAKADGDLVVFDVKYSRTTSRHQSICRKA